MMRSYNNTKAHCRIVSLLALGGILSVVPDAQAADPFNEVNGMLVIEAENYHSKANTSKRDWYIFPTTASTPKPDPDPPHATGTGGGKYVEALPDTRVTHDDPLQFDVNYFENGNNAPRMNYRVKINSAGRYYVRARAYSTGTEDNGLHIGVNGTWPVSGKALQWCDGKHSWYWSGARRVPENHCGIENGIYLDLTAGEHTIMIGMREDGFELDRFILTKNSSYFPTGIGPAESPRTTGGTTSPSNSAPVVNAGPDQTITFGQTASLKGSASDDGRPNSTLTIRWRKVSGPGTVTFGSASSLSTTAGFSATGSYVLELSAYDGELTSTDRIGISVTSGSTSSPDPGDSTSDVLSMAASNPQSNISRGSHSWAPVSLNGVSAMRASPDTGARIDSNYTSSSPFLRFSVNFPATGTYYVWVYGNCTGNDNSVHAGVNGAAVASAANITLPVGRGWVWSGKTGSGQRATVNITKTGTQTVEIYMREDGFTLQGIALTKSSSHVPSGPVSGGSSGGSSGGTSGAFVQDSNGLVVMEAENYASKVDRGSHSWVAVSKSGAQAMEARPDTGARIHSNYTSTSPFLRFNVNFQKTGTHYIHLRGLATGNDNSAHAGVGGAAVASAANITVPVTSTWNWSGTTGGGQRATINISSTGTKTIEIYMREDGFCLDRVLITTSSSYSPSGTGPAQSPKQ
jgi:hypothetical protein